MEIIINHSGQRISITIAKNGNLHINNAYEECGPQSIIALRKDGVSLLIDALTAVHKLM